MDNNNQHIEAQITQVHSWQGPLPAPEDLKKYDTVVSGAAERIFSMAEKEMEHRHNKENENLKVNSKLIIFSTVFAFLCVIVLAGILCFAIYVHSDTGAIATAIGAIAAVVGLFTYGKSKQKN